MYLGTIPLGFSGGEQYCPMAHAREVEQRARGHCHVDTATRGGTHLQPGKPSLTPVIQPQEFCRVPASFTVHLHAAPLRTCLMPGPDII